MTDLKNGIVINDSPRVSVLMTAYNREKYIAEAIESVLASTYTNYELIIMDDGSSDNTVNIARSFEIKDRRVKVFKNETNLGQFPNRNMAATYAQGTYLKYVDSDDVIYPYTLEMMVNNMEQFPEAALGFCLTHGPCKKPLPYLISPREVYEQHFFNGGLLFVGPSGLIIKRKIFFEMKGFEEYGMPSDNHMALKIAGKYPVIAITRDLFWWRVHPEQAFQEQTKPQSILNNFMYISDLILKYSPLSIKENKRIFFNLNKIFYKNLIRLGLIKFHPFTAISLFLKKLQLKY